MAQIVVFEFSVTFPFPKKTNTGCTYVEVIKFD